ncbi:unnamed protein product, partial [Rotaria socialis]
LAVNRGITAPVTGSHFIQIYRFSKITAVYRKNSSGIHDMGQKWLSTKNMYRSTNTSQKIGESPDRTIQRKLIDMGIHYRKKKRAPRYTEKQTEEAPTCALRLYRTLLNNDFELIMGDEKYFTLTNESVSTNRGFYTSDPTTTPLDVKFKRTQKYPAKVLVWIAISEKGILKPFFSKRTEAINERTYLKKCVEERLILFVNSYHKYRKSVILT